jgi:hypothetical protein
MREKDAAARVQRALASRGLTLFDVSRESRRRYRDAAAYRIPHHFYADLAGERFSPRIEQVTAFSVISNYRLVDWLALFGLRLDDAPPLAASLPTEHTVLLDSTVYDREAWIEWFRNKPVAGPPPAIAPLGQLLESGAAPRQLKSLVLQKPSPFLYAKVGRQDAFAFPDLLPGSIVRIDTRSGDSRAGSALPANPRTLFLVEHSKGLTCCRLHVSRKNRVTLRSTQLAYAEVEMQLGREVRILGALDLEFRFLAEAPGPEVPRHLATYWTPGPLPSIPGNPALRQLIRRGRHRTGLSLREASARSERIAEALSDHRYFCTRGTLAAYETTDMPHKQIHRIFAICILYSLGFWDLLAATGVKVDDAGQEPMPVEVFGDGRRIAQEETACPGFDLDETGFLSRLVSDFEEIPLFLRDARAPLTGLRNVSLRDIVWLDRERLSLHPYLRGVLLAAIDRRYKKPAFAAGKPLWKQPLHLLLLRGGSYLCAGCSLEKDMLIVHPFANGYERPMYLRNRMDAEVVGKVVALLRKL